MTSLFSKLSDKLSSKKNKPSHLDEMKKKKSLMEYKKAVAYYKREEYENSKKFFEKALSFDPENTDAQHNLKIVIKRIAHIQNEAEEKKKKKDTAVNKTLSSESANILNIKSNEERDERFYYKALRIDSDSSIEEITERINLEFRKWRTRINSPNIKMRYEAEEMLAIISQARRKLIQNK
ncbi:MAG: tetratricopeptide repeat protein [Candidatus Delongbacteria bacterium]|jgi:tetratricopeptide (TPR) repeat protein|nr:tetratricopeptide repeat protein [Candidatus Delongbacteria bacterium]